MRVEGSFDVAKRLLLVDDEPAIIKGLKFSLEQDGYEILTASDGGEALEQFKKGGVDLILLDVMLPVMDGIEVCQRIREKSDVPIIMLTAKSEDMDKILGLEYGADDYMTKPFNPLELVARVKTLLRRYLRYDGASAGAAKEQLAIRGLWISREEHRCTLNGKEVLLTPTEFDILWYLCRRQGKVVSAEELFEAVWGEKYLDSNNTVMAHIARLREKLGEPPRKPRYVKTVWGVGYTVE